MMRRVFCLVQRMLHLLNMKQFYSRDPEVQGAAQFSRFESYPYLLFAELLREVYGIVLFSVVSLD